jgi:predicted GNAT family acetyltransferase
VSRHDIDYTHEPDRQRFVADLGESQAVLEYRTVGNATLDYARTYVPEEFRGKGIAAGLVAYALDFAAAHNYAVVPSCPFVARVIRENPRYAELTSTP